MNPSALRSHLDERRRAMLREMGIVVWWQQSAMPVETVELAAVSDSSVPSVAVVPTPQASARVASPQAIHRKAHREPSTQAKANTASPAPRQPPDVASATWETWSDAVASCDACAVAQRHIVRQTPWPVPVCDWMVVGDLPDEFSEGERKLGAPFVGNAGTLLDRILRAVGVRRVLWGEAPGTPSRALAYVTAVRKCRPMVPAAPTAEELAQCEPFLRREIALVQPKVIVCVGRLAMQTMLRESPIEETRLPLSKLRQRVWRYAGIPVVVTYPPDYLLRACHDKAQAWVDWCRACDVVEGQAGS